MKTALSYPEPERLPGGLVAALYGELEEITHYAKWRETGSHPTGPELDAMARRLAHVVIKHYEAERQMFEQLQRQAAGRLAAEVSNVMAEVRQRWMERPS